MSMIQMRGLIVLVSVNLDTKKIKMRIKEKTMNKKLDLHIQLPKGSIIHQERKLMRLQRKLEMELSPYYNTSNQPPHFHPGDGNNKPLNHDHYNFPKGR